MASAGEIERLRLRVEEDDVELVDGVERLNALDELLLGGSERSAFHAGRAVEDVDELAAFAGDAEDARLRVVAGAGGALHAGRRSAAAFGGGLRRLRCWFGGWRWSR